MFIHTMKDNKEYLVFLSKFVAKVYYEPFSPTLAKLGNDFNNFHCINRY